MALLFYYLMEIPVTKHLKKKHPVDPHQTPHDVVSDLGLHCLPMTLVRVFR